MHRNNSNYVNRRRQLSELLRDRHVSPSIGDQSYLEIIDHTKKVRCFLGGRWQKRLRRRSYLAKITIYPNPNLGIESQYLHKLYDVLISGVIYVVLLKLILTKSNIAGVGPSLVVVVDGGGRKGPGQ